MIPSNFRIEILTIRALLCAIGSKELTPYYATLNTIYAILYSYTIAQITLFCWMCETVLQELVLEYFLIKSGLLLH